LNFVHTKLNIEFHRMLIWNHLSPFFTSFLKEKSRNS